MRGKNWKMRLNTIDKLIWQKKKALTPDRSLSLCAAYGIEAWALSLLGADMSFLDMALYVDFWDGSICFYQEFLEKQPKATPR